MPIKLPKGFPRRKSSGTVLDDFSNTNNDSNTDTGSSFKVLARPHSQAKSFDGGAALRPSPLTPKPLPQPRSSFDEDHEDLFSVARNDAANRGSGATSNSLSTAPYDSAASSTRYSNSSTNPSSVDSGSGRNIKAAAGQPVYDDIPVPPPHIAKSGFLKNAGRTFSFGITKHNSRESNDLPSPLPSDRHRRPALAETRERAMTTSSVTTATAPRLDDATFSTKDGDDDFGNMFANLDSRSSRDVGCMDSSPPKEELSINQTNQFQHTVITRPSPLKSAQRSAPPEPVRVNRHVPVEDSPASWNSQHSQDGLIGSPSPSRTVTQTSPQSSNLRNITMNTIRSQDTSDDNMFEDTPLRRSPESVAAKPTITTSPRPPPSSFPATAMTRARTQSNGASSIQRSDAGSEYGQPAFDPSLLANVQLASRYEETASSPTQTNASKVMTPAEFERYKKQKEDTRRYNKVFGKADSDDGSGDDYDDEEDDEQEREKLAAKQRKKQEAHLAVYRQQMRKVAGDVPNPDQRPGTSIGIYQSGNASQNDLTTMNRRMSQLTVDGAASTPLGMGKLPVDDEPDEDEDVPLGILAAHGFPNKNKPPTRLAASTSNPNLRNLAQMQGGASVVGDPANRGSLPAFARHLPPDPYYGASLVHQAERAPLNMSQSQLVTQPQPSGAATAHPLHPAGLVGVIAGEERARALRRGSPNPQGGYDMPMGSAPTSARVPQFMPPQPVLTPSEHAQLQMSQSMAQMMQMQMQWMQQMSAMMGPNQSMQMPPMPMMGMGMGMGMPGMQSLPQFQQNGVPMQPQHPGMPHRPQSVPLQNIHGGQQRTMSTLSPSMAPWTNSMPAIPQMVPGGSVYAPSIAPSERSNVGLAPRYRPVSTMTQQAEQQRPNWDKRSSTFSSATFRPYLNENAQTKPTSTIRTITRVNDDEDDEQGWAEMKAKKEKKQRTWKLRKGNTNTLQELYNAPA
ncbi:hypothetical protein LTR64_008511 [Lithohypha guttulata]|uniref:Uncharacterized protein n=1 Tax=Lithohypha guttulata TaxID=1690604 RepID=A0AAN7TCD2_9EURO|nr:hypothetical protein LTR51_001724 [Lithohypha guttulata]KAK5090539.1 hypothetical protein LTR05_000712 [Lithohypha guttulata]